VTAHRDGVVANAGALGAGPAVQRLQENAHGPSWDYRVGSPHLVHWELYDRLVGEVLNVLRRTRARGLPPTVLEIGAGHGGYTEPVLASGAKLTATEMSRPSLARLQERFGSNENFSSTFDPDGSLDILGDQVYSLVLCVSVLHHIPDYEAFLRRATSRLAVGGSFVSLQDPLWYPSVSRMTRRLDRLAYLSWRATRGQIGRGARTQLRRMLGTYDESNPADMVEYHVVRNGVDQEALRTILQSSFEEVRLERYWSTQSRIFQRWGTRLSLKNTFMLVAQKHLDSLRRANSDTPERPA
jgi:SAM-dependent methyltransferase